ncbi:Transcription factor [Trichinella pseudospiralis]
MADYLGEKILRGNPTHPGAIETNLGWIVLGLVNPPNSGSSTPSASSIRRKERPKAHPVEKSAIELSQCVVCLDTLSSDALWLTRRDCSSICITA